MPTRIECTLLLRWIPPLVMRTNYPFLVGSVQTNKEAQSDEYIKQLHIHGIACTLWPVAVESKLYVRAPSLPPSPNTITGKLTHTNSYRSTPTSTKMNDEGYLKTSTRISSRLVLEFLIFGAFASLLCPKIISASSNTTMSRSNYTLRIITKLTLSH